MNMWFLLNEQFYILFFLTKQTFFLQFEHVKSNLNSFQSQEMKHIWEREKLLNKQFTWTMRSFTMNLYVIIKQIIDWADDDYLSLVYIMKHEWMKIFWLKLIRCSSFHEEFKSWFLKQKLTNIENFSFQRIIDFFDSFHLSFSWIVFNFLLLQNIRFCWFFNP